MEPKKEFHFADAYFIAERLDAIQNALPIPPHDEKEFHSKDNYIIWTKLSPAAPSFVAGYGQVYRLTDQPIATNFPVIWEAINESNGVQFVASSVTVVNAGIYSFEWKVDIAEQPV